ncbi:hypothetical protein AMS68_005431 [Peltaster fructicola]|uniref:C2H2-type domain-containing protein n=1 Tax=Peltaster fructicola TaxID=286661 RepID=A0A6H0XYU1_9PEZI|nr:hypothetical protein AMS68_005431 [Peltaster fructicola]
MNRSSATPSRELKFTKTGRISKATKGERVHACDECGKACTRRHKKNHSPGMLPCDYPGCGRSFFREDLLQRHKQRQYEHYPFVDRTLIIYSNEPDSSPHRRGSRSDHPSGGHPFSYGQPGVQSVNAECISEIPVAGTTITGNLQDGPMLPTQSRTSLHQEPFHNPPGQVLLTLTTIMLTSDSASKTPIAFRPFENRRSITSGAVYPTFGEPRRHSSPIRNAFPDHPYYGASGSLHNDAYYDPYRYPNASHSPNSAESALLPLSTVGEESIYHAFGTISTPSSDISAGPTATGPFNVSVLDSSHRRMSSIPPHMTSPEERDLLEQMDLQTPTASMQAPDFGPNIALSVYDREERYLNAFWQVVHPLWPVVHRPTFDVLTTSPLLKAAMISLGAQSIGDVNDFSNARILHERCIKVLRKRTNSNNHSYRLCDMQAVLLIELYSVYKSRRPPLQTSSCFEDVFRRLAVNIEAYPTTAPESFASMPDFVDAYSGMLPEVQKEAKRRLLIACYILDRQHSLFFGRKASECLTSTIEYSAFPQPLDVWNGIPEASVNTAYGHYTTDEQMHSYTYEALNTVATHAQHSTSPYDAFRSSFLTAALNDIVEGRGGSIWKPIDDAEASALLYAVDQSPRTLLAYHMFMLSKNTPIRDLLAVAGESWVMAEKITSQSVYSAAQLEASTWARDNSAGSNKTNALYHALQILNIHRGSTTPGVLYRDWAVYMATLVIWITAYVTQEAGNRQRLNNSATISQNDMDKAVDSMITAGPLTSISWTNASLILLWTRSKLQQLNAPHNCGLTSGCLDVLGKLISRGHENGWLR